jgi:hypothetical protein
MQQSNYADLVSQNKVVSVNRVLEYDAMIPTNYTRQRKTNPNATR